MFSYLSCVSLPTVLYIPTPTNHQFVRVREFSVHIAPSPPPLIPNTPHQSCEQSCQKVSVFGSLVAHTHTPLIFHVPRRAHQLAPSGTQIAYDAHVAAGMVWRDPPLPETQIKLSANKVHSPSSHPYITPAGTWFGGWGAARTEKPVAKMPLR